MKRSKVPAASAGVRGTPASLSAASAAEAALSSPATPSAAIKVGSHGILPLSAWKNAGAAQRLL